MIWLAYWALISLSLLLTFIRNIKFYEMKGQFGTILFSSIFFPFGILIVIYYNREMFYRQRKFWWNK